MKGARQDVGDPAGGYSYADAGEEDDGGPKGAAKFYRQPHSEYYVSQMDLLSDDERLCR